MEHNYAKRLHKTFPYVHKMNLLLL